MPKIKKPKSKCITSTDSEVSWEQRCTDIGMRDLSLYTEDENLDEYLSTWETKGFDNDEEEDAISYKNFIEEYGLNPLVVMGINWTDEEISEIHDEPLLSDG